MTPAKSADAISNLPAGIATRLGGTFYLINLMRHLRLPGCFEEQCRLASRVGAWGVLELLARELCAPEAGLDPVWALLAELDGREPHALPGASFGPVTDLRFPDDWRAGAPDAEPAAECRFRGNAHLQRWLAFVLPFIRARLREALGSEATADLPHALLEFPARIFATATHLDVMMALRDISLPVRRAGLDRDPGWLPEFGRAIAFHFQ